MKATRNYLDTIRKALENWQEWSENGDTILEEKGWLFLHGQLNIESRKLRELDVQEVKDEILVNQDGIRLRLHRLVKDYGISELRDDVLKIAGKDTQLTDAAINDQLAEYRSLIVVKTAKLAQAYRDCEKYVTPENPAGPEEQICPDETTTDIPTNVRELFASTEDCENFFKDGDSLDCAGWARRAYKYTDNEKLYFHIKGDKKNLYKEIKKRHPKIAREGTFTHTLNDLNNGTLK